MKNFLKFILALLLVLVIPAFLAPVIFPMLNPEKYPFERVLSRIVMIGGFAAVIMLFAGNLKAFKRFGFTPLKDWWRWLAIGLACGFVVLLSLELFQTLTGAFDIGLRVKFNRVPERFFKHLLTALVIGTTEEFFFRGFIFISLARLLNWKWSFVLTNMFYALLHFFHGTKVAWDHPTFITSFQVMTNWFTPLTNWQAILPAFFGLFLFGCILTYALLKSGGLYLPIGIHSGAVVFLKTDVMFFGGKGNFPVWLYGSKDFYDGVMGWIFLAVFWLLLWLWLRKRPIALSFFEK
ncbi:MAG: CPBP family intramembrane metalloprotease [Candidatus Omnitrophica bacterium]|nr:CPBP family intramembrane metalloprotease [Candidatus Omnitrophota bacterium]